MTMEPPLILPTPPVPPAKVAISPTGTPVVSPSLVPLMIGILVAINGAAAALALNATDPKVQMAAVVVAACLNSILGVLSPGLRKKDGA